MEGAELANTQTREAYPIAVDNFGLSSLEELVGDLIVYRNLEPITRQIPGLKSARYQLGLSTPSVPRKQENSYAQVALWILEQAQQQRNAAVEELLFIGDTLSGDGHTFQVMRSLRSADEPPLDNGELIGLGESEVLPSACFIGNEKAGEPEHFTANDETGMFEANRWSHLVDWISWAQRNGLRLDESTAVVLDLDKTAIGARGRNNRAIDVARLKGLYRTVGNLLGDRFNASLFTQHYEQLNRARYHHLTGDNQDYLAYICLFLNNDGLDCADLLKRIEEGAVQTFEQFVRYAEVCIAGGGRVGEAMRQAHEAVNTAVSQGDPTPFKQFRREEFLATLEHMNNLADDVPAADRFALEICITQEVREAVLWLKERGCLIISFSDKPDESSIPHRTRHRGKPPIHKAKTHAIGVSIVDQLRSL
jgi:phosphoserine phosphatase